MADRPVLNFILNTIIKPVAVAAIPLIEGERQTAINTALDLFDKYIEPLDIPSVPDAIADPIIRRAVEQVSGKLFDAGVAALKKLAV